MNRITTALLAALEALIVVSIGVGLALVPLTVLWATHFNLAVDWLVFWRAAADVWLLGNGVDLMVRLDPAVVASLGLPGAEAPFPITIALLGFGVLAVLLGVRTGRRAAESQHPWVGVLAAIATYGALATLIVFSAGEDLVRPSRLQGILLPTMVYALGVLAGSGLLASLDRAGGLGRDGRDSRDSRARLGIGDGRAGRGMRGRLRSSPALRSVVLEALRGGAAATAGVVAVSAVAVGVLIVVNYSTMVGLYETAQVGIVGGFALTLAQLTFIPNLVIWASAWFVGPGIALGAGTSVSPVGTTLGTVPGLPILGALPQGDLSLGFLGLLVPILVGYLCAVLTRARPIGASWADGRYLPEPGPLRHAVTGLCIGLVAGVLVGLLAWWSAGAIGPGRLAEVGPNPLLTGALAAAEIGGAACLGMLAGGRRQHR